MEIFRALGSLIEDPASQHRRLSRVLGLPPAPTPSLHASVVTFQRYPYASVHLGAEGMMGGEARDRVAGFRRALGVDGDGAAAGGAGAGGAGSGAEVAGAEVDHLAALLALLASLEGWREEEADAARAALLGEAVATLAWEHLLSWTGPYLMSFEGCGSAFHEAWAALLAESLDALAARVVSGGGGADGERGVEGAAEASGARPLPASLRAAPVMADPRRDGGRAFAAALLAPARSGVIVLRDDLVRLGRDTGMACRAGERRYVLGAYLAQDPGAALTWLSGHAARWSRRVAARGPAPIARWWSERAEASAGLLAELAAGAAGGLEGVGGIGQEGGVELAGGVEPPGAAEGAGGLERAGALEGATGLDRAGPARGSGG